MVSLLCKILSCLSLSFMFSSLPSSSPSSSSNVVIIIVIIIIIKTGSSNKSTEAYNRHGNTKTLPTNDNKCPKDSRVSKVVAGATEQEEESNEDEGDDDDNIFAADDDDNGRCEEIEDDETIDKRGSKKMGMLPAGRIIFEFFKAVAKSKKKARARQHAKDKTEEGLPNIPQTSGLHDNQKKAEGKHLITCMPKSIIVHHKKLVDPREKLVKGKSSAVMTLCPGYCSEEVLCVVCPDCLPLMDEEENEQ